MQEIMQRKVEDFIERFKGDDTMCPLAFAEMLRAMVGLPSSIVGYTILFGVAPVVTLEDGTRVLLGPPADTVNAFFSDFFLEEEITEDEQDAFFETAAARLYDPMPEIDVVLGWERSPF